MKEQARLREEMNYQYRLGNFQVRSFVLNLQARYDGLTYTPITLSKSFFIIRLQLQSKKDWILMPLCSSRPVESLIPCSCSSWTFRVSIPSNSILNCCFFTQVSYAVSVSVAVFVSAEF